MTVENPRDPRWYAVTGPLNDLHDSAADRTMRVGGGRDEDMVEIMEAAEAGDKDRLISLANSLGENDLRWQLIKQAELAAAYREMGINALNAVSEVQYPDNN